MTDDQPRKPHPIVIAVAAMWNIPADEVTRPPRTDKAAFAQQDAMVLLRLSRGAEYRGLARIFGVDQQAARQAVKGGVARIRRDVEHSARLMRLLLLIADPPRNASIA